MEQSLCRIEWKRCGAPVSPGMTCRSTRVTQGEIDVSSRAMMTGSPGPFCIASGTPSLLGKVENAADHGKRREEDELNRAGAGDRLLDREAIHG